MNGNNCVPVCEIIAAQEAETAILSKNKGSGPSISQELFRAYPSAFTVSYVERASHHRWRTSDVTFRCPSAATCHQWVQTIREHLESERHSRLLGSASSRCLAAGQPMRLLVYINPYGGKQQGKRIYEQRVAPLFARASISTHSPVEESTYDQFVPTVTQFAEQARDELASSADLEKYDGVVCVGGDGMFSEVIHGLIARTQRDAGLDQNCAEGKLAPCRLRVGIIPAVRIRCTQRVWPGPALRRPSSSSYVPAQGASFSIGEGQACVTNRFRHGFASVSYNKAGNTADGTERTEKPKAAFRVGEPRDSPKLTCRSYAIRSFVRLHTGVTFSLERFAGDSQPMDVCSVHRNDKLLRYSASLLGYGFYGDVLADSETKRWMGPARYSFSEPPLLPDTWRKPAKLRRDSDPANPPFSIWPRCRLCRHDGQLASEDRQVCRTDEDIAEKEHQDKWQVVHGKFRAINAATMSCACPRSPEGLSPAAHLADGTTDLILVHRCSRLGFLCHLLCHTNRKDQFDMDFVEVHRVRSFRFTPKHGVSRPEPEKKHNSKKVLQQMCRDHPACSVPFNSSWSCDGEILHHAAIEVRGGSVAWSPDPRPPAVLDDNGLSSMPSDGTDEAGETQMEDGTGLQKGPKHRATLAAQAHEKAEDTSPSSPS
ncbi:ceramide kinase-like [Scleropages formosus]|uniref:Ceramide kinase-like n=1 Tax=Scleropages formosus TaxID=113540 RepID=A0A0P7UJF1_SCLFO|nr:ceramide kinase-like [Scleropages formosus]